MDRYNHVLGCQQSVSKTKTKTALEKFKAIGHWYESDHFENIIKELKQYFKSIPNISFSSPSGWFVKARFFEKEIRFNFCVTFDKGYLHIFRRTRSILTFEINPDGTITEFEGNRAEIIADKLFDLLTPFDFPEPEKEMVDDPSVEEEISSEGEEISSEGEEVPDNG